MDKYKSNEIKLTIGEEKALYISILSDLGGNMLKLDFPMGEYGLYPFHQGYYLGVKDYTPKSEDAIQVFNTRDGHKGLSATYHDGKTDNVHLVRIFNHYINEHLPDKWWERQSYSKDDLVLDESETDEFESDEFETDESDEYIMNNSYSYSYKYYQGQVKFLRDYNNIPVFFYLAKQINVDDLSKIKLECASVIKDCGNVDVCWYVIHAAEGRIGIAVQQKELYDMMGDQAGLCLLASNGCRAVGNYDAYNIANLDEYVFHPDHKYECEFKPCFCNYEYESARKRREEAIKRWQHLQSIYQIPEDRK